jgi:transcriptional regulator with XRE-family HTH domain
MEEDRHRVEERRILDLIKQLAKERGVSIRQMEVRAGVSPSVLYKVLSGKVSPSLRHLLLMCDALGLPWADFYALAAKDGAEEEPDRFEERVLELLARRGFLPNAPALDTKDR